MPPLGPFAGLLRIHAKDVTFLQRLLDPLGVAVLFWLLLGPSRAFHLPGALLPPIVWVLLVSAVVLPSASLYSSFRQRSLISLARRVSSGWASVLALLLLLSFLAKLSASFSRFDTTLWALLSWLLLLANHVGLRSLLRWHRSHGGNQRTIAYWGMPPAAQALQQQLLASPWMGLRLEAWFSPVQPRPDETPSLLPPCGGGLAEMRHWLEQNQVDRIFFSHITRDGIGFEQVLALFGDTCVPVIYVPAWASPSMQFRTDQIGTLHCVDLWGGEQAVYERQLKRCFDLLLTSLGLLLLTPLLLPIALAVALSSPGPILFVQDRYGLDGKRFRILKFRTMRVLEAGDTPGLRQATRNDPRVTPVGAFLRRWSLDELPQLFNVLLGDMSLVGPRPHAVDHNEQYRRLIPGYMQRHGFKPGITGLAQVEGWRGETASLEAMAQRVDADLRYQREWSLKLDIKILLKTLLRLRSPNAY
ncbi:undecaprenyl-phosphate glucose phosphotransferase [Synechococcus sp. CCY9202]|uniref:undecaprenyl-phosphate glucose phosphotransferase n=1 Tax=Synechococcus sp. CCY9202 TaxID=174698 RepID=UPI002B1EDF60|nr:undecaprenyl-phosphate glucose phosphotransferase [Synechococcus sp. CCY9202]MEA5423751.1 undecaprenyl-phosphate glucose phosphotransferase [Synechococcus sp. CCY9202]